MNRNTVISILLIGLLIVGLMIFWAMAAGNSETENQGAGEGDLLLLMFFAERFAEKLHAAGEAENWELASFYAHELEEVGEDLRDGGFIVHDHPLDDLADSVFLPAVEEVDSATRQEEREAFARSFSELVQSCNACHTATGYEQIVIQVPDHPAGIPLQRFAP